MRIPIIINNRDILDSVIAQIEFFSQIPEAYIILLDNASTYPPLIEWYRKMTGLKDPQSYRCWYSTVSLSKFYFFPENRGPRAGSTILHGLEDDLNIRDFRYYFLSDADMGYTGISPTFLKDLQAGLDSYPEITGCGVSIRINDLPDTPMGRKAKYVESGYWTEHPLGTWIGDGPSVRRPDTRFYVAACDTGGVLRRRSPMWNGDYHGLRSCQHIARHRPTYFVNDSFVCSTCHNRRVIDDPMEGRGIAIGATLPCNKCATIQITPPDFQYYYAHANPEGTCYTAAVLDPTTDVKL